MPKYDIIPIDGFGSMNTALAPTLIKDHECVDAVNLQQVQTGWWSARLGSDDFPIHKSQGFTNNPVDVRLIGEYTTTTGTPAVGSPGVEAVGVNYVVVFCNTDAGATIAVYRDVSFTFIKKWEVSADGLLDVDGVTTVGLVAETELIIKCRQAQGKLVIPLPTNKVVNIWIENGIWYAAKVSTKEMTSPNFPNSGVSTVVIDVRNASGQENFGQVQGSLVVFPYKPVTNKAIEQTTTANHHTIGATTGQGAYGQRIVCRADDQSGIEYVDCLQNPNMDTEGQPFKFDGVQVGYTLRNSPHTGLGYASAIDITFRPTGQVEGFDALAGDAKRAVIPESRWGYRFVYQFADGTYSNPSSDMWVGDMEWSVLTQTDATNLHSVFASDFYGEPVSGLESISTAASDIAVNGTTVTVQTGDGAKYPPTPFFLLISDNVNTDLAWCTNRTGDVLTFSRGLGNHAFTHGVAGDPVNLRAYFDASSKGLAAGGTSASYETGAFSVLQSFKSKIYDPSHPHYSDDVWVTIPIDNTAVFGQSFQQEIGLYGDNDTGDLSTVLAPGVDSGNPRATNFGFTELIDSSNRLSKAAGFTLNCNDTDINWTKIGGIGVWGNPQTNTHIASGARSAYLGTGASKIAPNLVITPDPKQGMDYISNSVGALQPYLILDGMIDWEFFANPDNNASDRNLTIVYRALSDEAAHNYPSQEFYSFRRLIPCKRFLWDWQLSRTVPTSVIFNCPRIQLKIQSSDIPPNAVNLLIFRTLNSYDPAFNATQFGLIQTVPIQPNTDVTFFDTVTDQPNSQPNNQSIDFSVSPSDYQGLRNGIACADIELKGERANYARSLTEYYLPYPPRNQQQNTNDSSQPMNTDCRFVAVTSTDTNAFPAADYVAYTGMNPQAATRYLLVYRDKNNVTSLPVIPYVFDGRGSTGDNWVVHGYFLGHGYDDSIQYLDIYRYDYTRGTGDYYVLVTTLTKSSGGVFYDDLAQTTNTSNLYSVGSNTSMAGTIAVTHGSASIVGTGTSFTLLSKGQVILIDGLQYTVATITDNTHMTVSTLYGGATASGLSFVWQQSFGVWKTIQDPSGVRFSEPQRPEFILQTSLQDVFPGDGEDVACLTVQKDNLVVFKPNSMHRIMLDTNIKSPQEERLETISLTEGCIAPNTLVNHGDILYYLSNKGLREYNGTTWRNFDELIYNDIQKFCRFDDVESFTACWMPHYGQYWLSINTHHYDVTTDNAVDLLNTDATLTFPNGIGATIPVGMPFSISDGANTDTGYILSVTGDVATIDRFGTTHTFLSGSTVTVFYEPTYVYVFDIEDKIVSRFLFDWKKYYYTKRNGFVVSSLIENPAFVAGDTGSLPFLVEDGGINGTTADDATDASIFDVSWKGKQFIGASANHIKRVRRWRLRVVHSSQVSKQISPLAAMLSMTNAGMEPSNVTTESPVHYHKVPSSGVGEDNVQFTALDVVRGADFQPQFTCGAENFVVKGIEIFYHLLRRDS